MNPIIKSISLRADLGLVVRRLEVRIMAPRSSPGIDKLEEQIATAWNDRQYPIPLTITGRLGKGSECARLIALPACL
jgi:hypothetical protein